jgi:hypothetical protein
MIVRYWFFMIVMAVCAYGTLGVLLDAHMRFRFTPDYWQYYLFIAAPYLLALMSASSWHRCYVWRRMIHRKQAPFNYITRGVVDIYYREERPSFLEGLCSVLVLFSIAAILHHWDVQHPMRWLGVIILLWFVLRLLFKTRRADNKNTGGKA